MMTLDEVVETVRSADPLDPNELDAWLAVNPARDRFDDRDVAGHASPQRRRRRARHVAVVAVGATTALASVAAAAGILGRPAPDRVKQHLSGLDAGMPADLRYNPDVDGARSVAATASGVLFLADLKAGGYCVEVVSDGDRPRGASCLPGSAVGDRPLEVTAPIPTSDSGALLVGGRANDARIAAVAVRYADKSQATIAFGLDRAWLLEVPDAERASALAEGVTIVGLDAHGAKVATVAVPPLHDDDPNGTAHDSTQPVVVMTISDGSDYALLLGLEGRVNAPGATRLDLRYPDGTTVAVALAPDGSYRFMIPPDRRDAFGRAAGSLVASDAAGHVLATAPVASVAYWRARNR
jgi:hypothetical protein